MDHDPRAQCKLFSKAPAVPISNRKHEYTENINNGNFYLQNLASILSSSKKYGPPDSIHRQKRRKFTETLLLRRCSHNCNVVDEMVDCNHLPLTSKYVAGSVSESSLKDIYLARYSVNESQHSFK
ncbi:unnamed protein product [Diatraea saccharalis]|uniref:Uncharacterized protein n=1 Tax=Diatraea saccharalis TaxID=40085 RepID=A0A9P0C699_9NEOP|nr:unnamed protein product [Diatraea saccharalis]